MIPSAKKTDARARLERAITYWIKHRPVATVGEIKRVAGKFGTHPRSLREAIKLLAEKEAKQKPSKKV